jgi:SNF2 family DNA or RNA helicase
MKKILKPFQQIGGRFLAERRFALLADEMGLGKTVQALAAAAVLPSSVRHVLVVCPASVRLGWAQELAECFPPAYPGQRPFKSFDVISYHGATSHVTRRGLRNHYDLLILDEAHYLKTPDSQRTKAIFGNGGLGLARRADRSAVAARPFRSA